ncbi:MAG: NADH:ubiquinone reductase (Na(+)-transporting) subunit B [Deltaproteobacteria bacterium]|nr:NADH:ubiquinone reductase (Na(+)-transporting) subunit B [Deltaproteobacteria bacterium]
MKFLRDTLDKLAPLFEEGGKLHKYEAFFEAPDTLLYTPGKVTKEGAHVRDSIDQKRMMITVVVALLPCVLMAMWNTGRQALLQIDSGAGVWRDDLNTWLYQLVMGASAHDPDNLLHCLLYGGAYFLPVFAVTGLVGGNIEMVTAMLRKHEVNEGFLVTMFLFPLICPPTIPLWQVALGITFGVVVGKEMFGGTGMNVLNPALTGRAFLFFAYPAQISGDKVWTAAESAGTDGYSGATWLARAAEQAGALEALPWMDAFIGVIPGSMGETSAVAALFGLAVLLVTRVGAWQTVLGVTVGTIGMTLVLNGVGSDTNPMFAMPFWWHMVLGGWAFGAVFMATDPVSSAFTSTGKLAYGFSIGLVVVLVRVVNPAYPEGMMLAILFMNLFAPLFDHFVIQANIKRRAARYAA